MSCVNGEGMIKIAIIDDEENVFRQLKEKLETYCAGKKLEIETVYFSETVKFIEGYREGKFDLIFLDICVPRLNGMKMAYKLREIDKNVIIIFVTNMHQYAIKGYEVDALGYVLKPVDQFTLNKLMDKAVTQFDEMEEKYIVIHTAEGIRKISVDSILYVEIQGHRITYYTSSEEEIGCWGTLSEVESKLPSNRFYRCNVCYLVNMSYVQGIKNEEVTVRDVELKVARSRKKDFMITLAKFWGTSGRK